MRHILIGDVHGMDSALEVLLERVAPTAADQIIFVGDLVDKGPDSAGVVRRVRELSDTNDVVLVLGNHEDTHARYRKHLSNLPNTAATMANNKPMMMAEPRMLLTWTRRSMHHHTAMPYIEQTTR